MAEKDSPDLSAPALERLRGLARFGYMALRITASTIAVVALLRQSWIPAVAFAVAWLLLLQAPRLFPVLEVETNADR
jgi:hypothetical protein